MPGRENSVTRAFEERLVRACTATLGLDISGSLEGSDREFNADNFFAIDGAFFLVEFKSEPGDFSAENKKRSACNLCGCLLQSSRGQALHDRCHFACAGKKTRDALVPRLAVYQQLVCGRDKLPDCEHVKHLQTNQTLLDCEPFFNEVKAKVFGVSGDEFKQYLKWLEKCPGKDGKARDLELKLYVFSRSGDLIGRPFNSFDEVFSWCTSAIADAKDIDRQPKP